MHSGHRRRVKFSLLTDRNAHWDFEEGTDSTVGDISENTNTGTETGGMTWGTGRVGAYAGGFDGTNDYVSIPDHSSLTLPGDFSVSVWAYKDTTADDKPYVFAKGDSASYSAYALMFGRDTTGIGTSGDIGFKLYDTSTAAHAWVNSNVTYSASTWYCVQVTWELATLTGKIYVNRVDATGATDAQAGFVAPEDTTLDLTIGMGQAVAGPDRYFNGDVDDLRIYSRILSAPEIYELSIRE